MKVKREYSELERKIAKMQLQALDRVYYLESLGWTAFDWQKEVLRSNSKRKINSLIYQLYFLFL